MRVFIIYYSFTQKKPILTLVTIFYGDCEQILLFFSRKFAGKILTLITTSGNILSVWAIQNKKELLER